MSKKAASLLLAAFYILPSIVAMAQETPLWIRKNQVSPDGRTIAFCYGGDIFTVPVQGGEARQITSNPAYDSDPIFTPDSRQIVFSSWREGGKDIYVTSVSGGRPTRVTTLPGNETPKAVLPDGRILFSASLQDDPTFDGFPGTAQLYSITPGEGRPTFVTSLPMMEISVGKDGTLLYEDYKGYEDALRKHHTSSVTRDIWAYIPSEKGSFGIDPKGTFKKLSTFKGEDRNPVLSSDGDTFYFLSEKDSKNINVFKSSISSPGSQTRLTSFEKDPVRFLSVSNDGLIVFSQNGELYTMREGSAPRKVDIRITKDDPTREMDKISLTTGATSMAVSESGKEIAVVVRGDVFVTSEEYPTTRRITNTPQQERDVDFGKDGRELYYAAERNGNWAIYRTILTDKNDKSFTYAVKTKEELFSDPGETCQQPDVSPDGKWVAYLRNRSELVVKPTGGGAAKSLIKDANYSYQDGDKSFEWSPDSRYLLSGYQANGGWNNEDVALVEVETGKITNLTRSGYSDGDFRWALGGKAMTWQSDKNGYRSHGSWGAQDDIYIMFFDGEALTDFRHSKEDEEIEKMLSGLSEKKQEKKEKKDSLEAQNPKKLVLNLEGLEDRTMRLTRASSSYAAHFLSPDGRKLYYITPLESGSGLCEMDLREGGIKVLKRGVRGSLTPSKDGKTLYVFSATGLSKITLQNGQSKDITFRGDFEFRPAQERTYMFEHIWKQVKEKFYDPDLHKADWDYCRENYSRFLPHINNYFDFQDMLSEMLGELNGSHTGARYYPTGGETLGRLGVLFDYSYSGDGLRIAEVLPGGVLNLADSSIKAGDIIESIDGTEIKAGSDWYSLLSGKAGKKVVLFLKVSGKSKELIVQPAATESALLYRRWVRRNEELVEKLSGGRIGYVHVQGMDSPSFREVYSKALGKYRTCDALIVDTRHNGGGWLHDDLVTFLGGKAYAEFRPRGQYIGTEPYNKWNKPSCVLVCEDNYSDASGFPYAYKTLGIGKIIGTPVPGTMTAVWWERQINSSIVFGIPQVGTFGLKEGRFLENMPIEPDIEVYNSPSDYLTGEDTQLRRAVEEMLRQVGK